MKLVLCSVLAASLVAGDAGAIVVRHDRGPEAYLAEASRFPALFALYRTKEGHRDCIATLIAPRWAVTAAHCTEDPSLLTALEGSGHRVEIGHREAVIDRVARHRGGENGRAVDLALVRFTAPVAAVEPVALYRAADEGGRTVLLPGWGGVGDGLDGLGSEDGLFRVAENRVDAARDGWLIWQFDDPRSGTGRALALEGISGPGDSGGPALIMSPLGLAVAGIGSAQRTYGRAEGLYGADEYFVRVSDFVPWIDATIAVDEADAEGEEPPAAPPAASAPAAPSAGSARASGSAAAPFVTIADFAWLQGHWRGEGLGGVVEEVWFPPAGGSMAGMFRAVADDAVSLYELFIISEPDLALRLKHFHPDVTGWEERDEVVTFPLLRVTPDEAVFEGLAFRRVGADGLQAVVRIGRADGSESDLELSLRRVGGEPGGDADLVGGEQR